MQDIGWPRRVGPCTIIVKTTVAVTVTSVEVDTNTKDVLEDGWGIRTTVLVHSTMNNS